MLNSLEGLCITRVAAVNSFASVINPRRGAYIVIHRQTISLCHTSSVWLDTLYPKYIYIYIYMGGLFVYCCMWPSDKRIFLSSASLDGVGLSERSLCVGYIWEVLVSKID